MFRWLSKEPHVFWLQHFLRPPLTASKTYTKFWSGLTWAQRVRWA